MISLSLGHLSSYVTYNNIKRQTSYKLVMFVINENVVNETFIHRSLMIDLDLHSQLVS